MNTNRLRCLSENRVVYQATRGRWGGLLAALTLLIGAAVAPAVGGHEAANAPATRAEAAQSSFLTVAEKGGRTIFEIPRTLLGKDILWYVERGSVSRTVAEGAGKSPSSLMIRLERVGGQMLIRNMSSSISRRASTVPGGPASLPTTDQKIPPMARAVAESSLAPPIAAVPIAAEGAGGSLIVDVTDVFRQPFPELGLETVFGAAQVDPSRTFIESVRVFPRNILVSAFFTAQPLNGGESVSAVLKHSWTLLPDTLMKSRNFDNRIGNLTVDFEEYSSGENMGSRTRGLILRYRLEKKDPNAALSEPVKPIVYYIGRTIPTKWQKYVRQGIEDWNVAFEAAGFKNAIIAKNAPTVEEDPNWDPSDTRHSVIRWVANPVINAQGPNVADPRTGEILSAHILIWEDVLRLANAWYYAMCSAADPRAHSLPLSDELTGRMMRYIVSHEVGHTLGMRHNHRASTAYTVAQLRDPKFTAQYRSTASIMAYGRMNYVAQPGDGVAPESLMPHIGPYDIHFIKYTYTPLPADQEAKILEEWASASLKDPFLAFGGEDFAAEVDPQVLTQNIGKERVEATRLGLANLKIAMNNLVPAYKKGHQNYDSLYDRWIDILNVRHDYLMSVTKEIGGREESRSDVKREPQFRTVPVDRQRKAVAFLLEEGLHWDPAYYSSGVLANAIPLNLSHDLRKYQGALLGAFFQPLRLALVNDARLDEGDGASYTLDQYIDDIARGVFSEIEKGTSPTLLRRSLHRDFFVIAERQHRVNPTEESQLYAAAGAPTFVVEALSSSLGTDTRVALRLALTKLAQRLSGAIVKTKDPLAKAHWEECLKSTQRLLSL